MTSKWTSCEQWVNLWCLLGQIIFNQPSVSILLDEAISNFHQRTSALFSTDESCDRLCIFLYHQINRANRSPKICWSHVWLMCRQVIEEGLDVVDAVSHDQERISCGWFSVKCPCKDQVFFMSCQVIRQGAGTVAVASSYQGRTRCDYCGVKHAAKNHIWLMWCQVILEGPCVADVAKVNKGRIKWSWSGVTLPGKDQICLI